MRDLEVASLSGSKAIAPRELAAPELEVAVELAGTDPEGLVPVVLVYEQLAREHRAAQRPVTAAHAGEMAFALAGLYAEAGGAATHPLAARLLVGLAVDDTGRGLSGLGARALAQALALDPDNDLALLCLAIDAERRGLYREAAGYLERLLRLRPADRETRLRLAVNRARLGERRQAAELLETISGEESGAPGEGAGTRREAGGAAQETTDGDWAIAVAYHELARMQLAEDQAEAAERTARAGLARFPKDEKLALLLGLSLDVQGRAAETRAVLAVVAPAPADSAAPRRRYGHLPEAALATAREALERSAAERLPALATALGGAAPSPRPGGGSGR
jgi:tetratricopeptide (TPR) repeat protein